MPEATSLLRVVGVQKRFGGLLALDGVDFSVEPGEIVSLIGPNGAGKSTLLDVICGHTKPQAGRVLLGGVDVTATHSRYRARFGVARTFQSPTVLPFVTLRENVLMGTYPWNRSPLIGALFRLRVEKEAEIMVENIIERLQLGDLVNRPIGSLSYGQLKSIEIGRALASKPKVMLLDEPLAGLSEAEAERMEGIIAELAAAGTGVLLVEHHLRTVARLSDEILVLHHGRQIGYGPTEQILSAPEVRSAYSTVIRDQDEG